MKYPAFVGAVALALSACANEPPKVQRDDPPPAVAVVAVAGRPLATRIQVSGTLLPREDAAVLSELSGYRVLRVFADEGDWLRAGQPVAVLDGALLEGEMDRARADVAAARVAVERAASEFRRVQDLTGSGAIAEETITQRGFEVRTARTRLRSAEAVLRDVGLRRGRLTLTSPVAGVVLQRNIRPGDVAGQTGEPSFRLARDGRFELDAEVPEHLLPRLKPGIAADVTLASGEKLTGTVRRLGERIDPTTRSGRVRILIPLHPSLRLGGFATATIGGAPRPVRAVPERSLSYEGGPSVMAVAKDGRVARMAVRTGARADGLVELVEGPPPGTRIVAGGGALVTPGQIVRPVEAGR